MPEQVEGAVRQWFDFYDEQLGAAIKENIEIRSLRVANVNNGYDQYLAGQDIKMRLQETVRNHRLTPRSGCNQRQ